MEKNLSLRTLSNFDEHAKDWLKKAITHDKNCSIEQLENLFKSGQAGLYGVYNNKNNIRVGSVLCKIDVFGEKKELVIVAGSGSVKGVSLSKTIIPLFDTIAQNLGCNSVRFHTARGGLGKLSKALGYNLLETVYRKEV